MIETAAGTRYKGIIIPGNNIMPSDVIEHISELKSQGAKIIKGDNIKAMEQAAKPELMRKNLGLKMIRRANSIGHHYFIANLTSKDIASSVALAVNEKHGIWYNPMTGEYHEATIGDKGIQLNLKSGESRILITSNKPVNEWKLGPKVKVGGKEAIAAADSKTIDLTENAWKLSFIEDAPKVDETFNLKGVKSWEGLSDKAKVMMGTGVYETTIKLSKDCLLYTSPSPRD